MPQLIQLSVPTVIKQNVAYALPSKLCYVTSGAPVEISLDNITWTVLGNANTSGTTTSASFIRCPGGDTTIVCKDAEGMNSGSGGGGNLPPDIAYTTAANVFTQPNTFSAKPAPALTGNIRLADGEKIMWRNTANNGDIGFEMSFDAFNLIRIAGGAFNFNIDANVWPGGGVDHDIGVPSNPWNGIFGKYLSVRETTFATLPAAPPIGTLANVSDSTVNTTGSTVAGGGANHILARWNGTVWRVVA